MDRDRDDRLLKLMVFILHNAQAQKIYQCPNGFVNVDDILKHSSAFHKCYTIADVERVAKNEKNSLFLLVKDDNNSNKIKIKFNPEDKDSRLQKTLGFYLRHHPIAQMSNDGFINVAFLLRQKQFKRYSLCDIVRVIESEEFPRIALKGYEHGKHEIKATHGHTIKRVHRWCFQNWPVESTLQEVTSDCTFTAWADIKVNGFRLTDWLAFFFQRPDNEKEADSKKDVKIYIDAQQARADGMKFYTVPENDTIATEGCGRSVDVKYIKRVIDKKSGLAITF